MRVRLRLRSSVRSPTCSQLTEADLDKLEEIRNYRLRERHH